MRIHREKQIHDPLQMNVLYPVTAKHPKQVSPFHIPNSTFVPYSVLVFFCLRIYLPSEDFLLYIFCQNLYTFHIHAC